jgi:hypothetical protein
VTRLGPIYPLCRFIHTSAVRTSTTLVFLPSRFSALSFPCRRIASRRPLSIYIPLSGTAVMHFTSLLSILV